MQSPSDLPSLMHACTLPLSRLSHSLNNSLALASMSVREPKDRPGRSTWVPAVSIQGKLYHRLGPLAPTDGETRQFAQLYVHDPADTEATTEFDARVAGFRFSQGTSNAERGRVAQLLRMLQDTLHDENPYVRDFIMAGELFANDAAGQPAELVISRDARPSDEARTLYDTDNDRPRTFQEVTVLVGEGEMERGCVRLRPRHVPNGAKWQRTTTRPKGTLLTNAPLEALLYDAASNAADGGNKVELSRATLDDLDLSGLRADHYVVARDGSFFEQPDRRGLQSIDFSNRAFDPLHFVLLFPLGDDGWHYYMERSDAPPLPRANAAADGTAAPPTDGALGAAFVADGAEDDVQSQTSEWSAASQCMGEPCASQVDGADGDGEFCDRCWDKWNKSGATLLSLADVSEGLKLHRRSRYAQRHRYAQQHRRPRRGCHGAPRGNRP